MSAISELAEFFKSVDEGMERYVDKAEEDLHKIHGGEVEKLIIEKEINDIQKTHIYEYHFSAMDLRLIGRDPTIAFRKGIRHVFKNCNKNILETIEKILKLVKDYNFCESSQLKLFVNCVKTFLHNTNLTLDDVNNVIINWCDEIKPDENIIIKTNLL
jgi:hypothetical protein